MGQWDRTGGNFGQWGGGTEREVTWGSGTGVAFPFPTASPIYFEMKLSRGQQSPG